MTTSLQQRFTLTFADHLCGFDEPLAALEALGIGVEGVHRFIGTAIVRASDTQAAQARQVPGVVAVLRTTATSAS